MSNVDPDRLIAIVTEEVRRALAERSAAGPPKACGEGVSRGPVGAGPGRGVPAGSGFRVVHNPTPATPCSASRHECTGCGWSVSRRPDDARKIIHLGATRLSVRPQAGAMVPADLAPMIDHTLLKAEATREQLDGLCDDAARHAFASVCVNPSHVRYCRVRLRGSDVMVVTVVGFPLGATSTAAKVCETRKALEDGADEIDMVINIGLLKSRDYATVLEDIRKVVKAAHPRPVKVIIETASLEHDEKIVACALSKAAGAAFVKTSTGFGAGGATAEDVALMKRVVGDEVEVKASGGIHSFDDAMRMIRAGATRLGASASVAIVTGKKPRKASGY